MQLGNTAARQSKGGLAVVCGWRKRKSYSSRTEDRRIPRSGFARVLADPVVASDWLALCLASKAATRILVYSYAKGTRPVFESK